MKKFRSVLVIILLCLFFVLCYLINKNGILKIDNIVYDFIRDNVISDSITPFIKIITNLGGVLFTIILGLVIFIFGKNIRFFVTFNIVGVTVINQMIKHIMRRPRPDVLRLVSESGYSFPSGHSMVSMALYGIIIYLIYKKVNNKYLKCLFISLLSLLILLIGLSRIYVGVHYASDVLAGFILGLVYLIIYIWFYNKRRKNEK